MDMLRSYASQLEGLGAEGILRWSIDTFGVDKIALSSSLGQEDQALTRMLLEQDPKARVFTLDTGRLFQETYDLMDTTARKYGFRYALYFPDRAEVEKMAREAGPNLFYRSVEDRRRCCDVRKVRPLRRALTGLSAWICGLRREQSATRSTVNAIEWDDAFGLYKINPLYDWAIDELNEYLARNEVPVNRLHRQGFASIGCAPCTRATEAEGRQDSRLGRWWWEDSSHKECGLHLRPRRNEPTKEGTE